jgi:hypothetical protein
MNYLIKDLEKGYLDSWTKQTVDEYYDNNGVFRLKHPNYKPWTKSYAEFERQPVVLL